MKKISYITPILIGVLSGLMLSSILPDNIIMMLTSLLW